MRPFGMGVFQPVLQLLPVHHERHARMLLEDVSAVSADVFAVALL
jgi:hypothetical protein